MKPLVVNTILEEREDQQVPVEERKYHLSQSLANQLLKDQHICWETSSLTSWYPTVVHRASIKIVPREVTNIIDNDEYRINNIQFTKEQIDKALASTYPEYFI